MTLRVAAILVLLGLAGGSAVAAEAVPEPAACPAGHERSGRVAETVDGNTFRLEDGTWVRLAGIDAPPPGLRPDDPASPDFAAAARVRLAALVAGQSLQLSLVSPDRDRHGRLHAVVVGAGGKSLQEQMLGAGLARVHILAGEEGCAARFLAAEDAARKAGFGLWGSHAGAIRKADDPSLLDEIGLYELVEGRVVSVGRRSRLVFLDFGRNWQSDFTVMVDTAAAERMAGAGHPVEGLAKHRIRVRGVIEESGGPAIRVAEPSAIEVLDGE